MELLLTLWGTKSPAGGAGAPAVFSPQQFPRTPSRQNTCVGPSTVLVKIWDGGDIGWWACRLEAAMCYLTGRYKDKSSRSVDLWIEALSTL